MLKAAESLDMDKSECALLVQAVISCKDLLEECECVDNLIEYLKAEQLEKISTASPDDIEKCFLQKLRLSETEISVFPPELLVNRDSIDSLTFYLFKRRFGWSEQSLEDFGDSQDDNRNAVDIVGTSFANHKSNPEEYFGRINRSGSLPFVEESKVKTILNSKLDELIQL